MLPSEYYKKKVAKRKNFEDRAEKFADLTIPSIFRKEGSSGSDSLPDKYGSSLGAALVNGLSAKIALTLFPPAGSAFKLVAPQQELNKITGGEENMNALVNKELSNGTDRINTEIEVQDIRRMIYPMIDYLLVVGNCIMEKIPKKGIKIHGLRNIAVTLNDVGECIEMCIYEEVTNPPIEIDEKEKKEKYELYTYAIKDEDANTWSMSQELEGEIINEEVKYSAEDFPFEFQGMKWSIGEEWYRPYIEEYFKSLESYAALSRVLTQGSIIASKSITFVDEQGGRTRKDAVAGAQNGDVVDGRADDVTSFQHNKNFDFQIPYQVRAEFRAELEDAFLAKNSITRDAERVTAEEIRQMAQELETNLASMYTNMASRISRRIITWIMKELKLQFQTLDVKLITGLSALGQSNEVVKLNGYVSTMQNLGMLGMLKETELANRYAQGYGINTVNLLKTLDEIRQEQQAQQEAMAQQAMTEEGARSIGAKAGEVMTGGQQ